ncbi:hypothetical protein EKO25_22155 [Bacillus sp. SAJ1]|nr:hypothetical protein EKO25_22155 [Bacillus sp. SAJ1]
MTNCLVLGYYRTLVPLLAIFIGNFQDFHQIAECRSANSKKIRFFTAITERLSSNIIQIKYFTGVVFTTVLAFFKSMFKVKTGMIPIPVSI